MAFTVSRSRIAPCAAKVETTYGTDPTIAGASDGFATINSEVNWNADIQNTEFRNHGASFTRGKDVIGQRVATFNFTTQLQGSGTAGTAVQGVDAVLKASGLTGATVASTSVTYKPQAVGSLQSAAIKTEHNGINHQALGCYSNAVFRGRSGEPTFVTFAAQGLYAAPSIGSIASWAVGATGTDRAKPNLGITLSINNGTDNWSTPTVASYELDCGNDIRRIPDANSATGLKALLFADRNPRATVSLVMDLDTSGTIVQANEFYTDWTAATTHAVSWVVGSSAGNINTFTIPKAQIVNCQVGSGDGYRTLDVTYKVQHDTAETEFSLVQT